MKVEGIFFRVWCVNAIKRLLHTYFDILLNIFSLSLSLRGMLNGIKRRPLNKCSIILLVGWGSCVR